MRDVNFSELIGKKMQLTGVDFETESIKNWGDEYEDCAVINFVLDGKTYTACENPDDGYRSTMRYLQESETSVKNMFPPCEVIGQMRPDGNDYGWTEKHDVLDFTDTTTGKVVLSVGTGNTDDYYPFYVASFDPTAMAINAI